ncbi:hypothetical protein D3C85_286090 [compost metagenome]
MIKRFGFKNFYSFKEGTEVNFMLDGNVPSDIKNGRDFTTVLGIKGANGSGKTNLIKALDFLKIFCTNPKNIDISESLDVNTFNNSNEPCEFYVEFISNDTCYYYEAEVTTQEVIKESLYRKKQKQIRLFERDKNELSYVIKELAPLKYITLNKNTSVIGLANKLSLVSDLSAINDAFEFFSRILTNVDSSGFFDFSFSLQASSKEYYKFPDVFSFVKKIIRKADSGIKDIEIRKKVDDETGAESFYPVFIHEHCSNTFELTFNQESNGTKSLYRKLFLYWGTLTFGGILALDEFDIHIHSLILPHILELFTSDTNTKNAQFIFTAHNTEIIDFLKKYRTILVNKEDNESYCYRLDEIEGSIIRNDRSISPLYLDGKIGGVPYVSAVPTATVGDDFFSTSEKNQEC